MKFGIFGKKKVEDVVKPQLIPSHILEAGQLKVGWFRALKTDGYSGLRLAMMENCDEAWDGEVWKPTNASASCYLTKCDIEEIANGLLKMVGDKKNE